MACASPRLAAPCKSVVAATHSAVKHIAIPTPAADAGCDAYWADESAIEVVQRYLGCRLLIFNPTAHDANQCSCFYSTALAADLSPAAPAAGYSGLPLRFVLLRHTHRTNKEQHYELYARERQTVFDEASLPAGVKRAFAAVCAEVSPGWSTA